MPSLSETMSRASATLLSGSLPTSSATMESTTRSLFFLICRALWAAWRWPVTTISSTVWSSLATAVWAMAGAAISKVMAEAAEISRARCARRAADRIGMSTPVVMDFPPKSHRLPVCAESFSMRIILSDK